MKKIRLVTVVGARPQFIKASALSAEILDNDLFEEVIIHTGQHFDSEMSDVFFNELGIPKPIYNLGVGGGSHGENTGRMIIELEKVFITERPDAVVLFGDTDSTLAGAIAASKLHIPVVHIEAGLRSFNKKMPEEVNRILTDHVSSILFTPSSSSRDQLLKEGLSSDDICVSGDIMFDATLKFRGIAKQEASVEVKHHVENNSKYALLTLHRAENVDHK
jgi:UDP-GlcNAc3NAcA epimerase